MDNLENQEENGFDFLKRISKKAWIILGVLVLLASLAFNGWWLWQKEKEKSLQEGIKQGRTQFWQEEVLQVAQSKQYLLMIPINSQGQLDFNGTTTIPLILVPK